MEISYNHCHCSTDATWLWQCDSGWSSCSPVGPSAAHLVCYAQKYDHVTHLWDLHWLRVLERIQFRLAVLVFRCRNNMAPPYLVCNHRWTDEAESLRRLRSSSQQRLIVPRTRLRTIGDQSFHVTVARAWNSLPTSVTTATSWLPSKDN